jgi:uncharacterized protein YdhG (YjbR/CyaY superfamily)
MAVMSSIKFKTVDDYIKSLLPEQKLKMQLLRSIIKKAAPNASELISYNMPSFNYHSRLVYYAAFKSHIGFYPMASGIAAFTDEISKYKWAKGSMQFPLAEPIPEKLVSKIIKYRVRENQEKYDMKSMKKAKKN